MAATSFNLMINCLRNIMSKSTVNSDFVLEFFKLNVKRSTFSKVLMIASEVSLFSRFISVIISWLSLFSFFWYSSPTTSSFSTGFSFYLRNFLSSRGLFLTFYLKNRISLLRLSRSSAKRAWSSLTYLECC